MAGTQLPAQLDATAIGEANIQNRDVRRDGVNASECLRNRSCLADNFEIVLRIKQVAHATADNFVVIDKKDSKRHRRDLATAPHPDRVRRPRQVGKPGASSTSACQFVPRTTTTGV